jgi:hypothetical protein
MPSESSRWLASKNYIGRSTRKRGSTRPVARQAESRDREKIEQTTNCRLFKTRMRATRAVLLLTSQPSHASPSRLHAAGTVPDPQYGSTTSAPGSAIDLCRARVKSIFHPGRWPRSLAAWRRGRGEPWGPLAAPTENGFLPFSVCRYRRAVLIKELALDYRPPPGSGQPLTRDKLGSASRLACPTIEGPAL